MEKKIIKVALVREVTKIDFENSVNNLLDKGYELHGEFKYSVISWDNQGAGERSYVQMMILREL